MLLSRLKSEFDNDITLFSLKKIRDLLNHYWQLAESLVSWLEMIWSGGLEKAISTYLDG